MAFDLSVCLIVKNEEKRLPLCLNSLPKSCEIIVVDTNSTDQTVAIASKFGAKVLQRAFDNYSAQKNFAIAQATRGWVLSIDADEVLTGQLRAEIEAIVASNSGDDGYILTRRLIFLGKKLSFGRSKDHVLRLFRRGCGKFVNEIHEEFQLAEGKKCGKISGELEHHSYENLNDYFERFNRYTSMIADKKFAKTKAPKGLLGLVVRRNAEFLKRYFFLLGFLDGYYGFLYAYISSFYVFVKYAKLRELYRQQ